MPFSTSNSPDNRSIVIDDEGQLAVANNLKEALRGSILDLSVDIAELNYANSLNADSRNQIFVDAFINSDKISSTNNLSLSTGQNGSVQASESPQMSDFEDGSSQLDWESNSTFSIDTNSKINGTNSLRADINGGSNDDYYGDMSLSVDTGQITLEFKLLMDDYLNQYLGIIIEDSEYNRDEIEFYSDGKVRVSPNSDELTNFSTGQIIDVAITWNFDTGEITFNVDGTTGTYSSNLIDLDRWVLSLNDYEGSGDKVFYMDDWTEDILYNSEGILTSVNIDKGYIPNAIQIEADRITDTDTSLQARVYDIDGNEKIIKESEFGDEVDLSFSNSAFNVDLELSTSDSTKTPVLNDYGLNAIR